MSYTAWNIVAVQLVLLIVLTFLCIALRSTLERFDRAATDWRRRAYMAEHLNRRTVYLWRALADDDSIAQTSRTFAEHMSNVAARANGDDVLSAYALAQLAHYFSTHCLHGRHDQCKATCKHCPEPCKCECHRGRGSE